MKCTGTSLQGYYPFKNSVKSNPGQTRSIGEFLLLELDKRLSLGKDEGVDMVTDYIDGFV